MAQLWIALHNNNNVNTKYWSYYNYNIILLGGLGQLKVCIQGRGRKAC